MSEKQGNNPTFYYTFGTANSFPFQKGWVAVEAPDRKSADVLFRRHFPDQTPGFLNCSSIFSSTEFMMGWPKDWQVCHATISEHGIQITPEKEKYRPSLAQKLSMAKTQRMYNSPKDMFADHQNESAQTSRGGEYPL